MSLKQIKINNFRGIDSLDISINKENRILCFVGENGSSKTSVLGLILESFLAGTRYSFRDLAANRSERMRLITGSEIKNDCKFYSSEILFHNNDNTVQTYKKVVILPGTDVGEYSGVIQGLDHKESIYAESTTVSKSIKNEFLSGNILLDRPSTRHEFNSMDLMNVDNGKEMIESPAALQFQRPFNIKAINYGKNAQSIILDLFFDSYIGYADSEIAKNKIIGIISSITGKDYGEIQISQAPYRRVVFSNTGDVLSLSQGELDVLSTITAIIEQQQVVKRDTTSDADIFDIPGVVLIDEVDLHLHPKAQEECLSTLVDIFKNIQFVVTTHSPFVIRGLPEASIVVSLPTGTQFTNNFNNMDIDSITNVIFNHEGGFSKETNEKLSTFKELLMESEPNIQSIRDIYNDLKKSVSAKNEMKLYLSSFAKDISFVEQVTGD